MANLGKMQGTPWHVERYHIEDNDSRRHRSHCVYFENESKYCMKNRATCFGASHCKYYADRRTISDVEKSYHEKNSHKDTVRNIVGNSTEAKKSRPLSEAEKRKDAYIQVGNLVFSKGKRYVILDKDAEIPGRYTCRLFKGYTDDEPVVSSHNSTISISQVDTVETLPKKAVSFLRASNIFPPPRQQAPHHNNAITAANHSSPKMPKKPSITIVREIQGYKVAYFSGRLKNITNNQMVVKWFRHKGKAWGINIDHKEKMIYINVVYYEQHKAFINKNPEMLLKP